MADMNGGYKQEQFDVPPGIGAYNGDQNGSNGRKRKAEDDLQAAMVARRRRDGLEPPEDGVTFKLLFTGEKVGGIIGKGGDMIKRIRMDTGATVVVHPPIGGCHERSVVIASERMADLPTCPAKDASLHCVTAALRGSGPDTIPDPPTGHTLKLLVHSAYVGAILGKGASSVKEVEGASGARVQVHHGERHPLSGPTEEVIKISGSFPQVTDALLRVIDLMRQIPPPPASRLRELPPGAAPYQSRGAAHNAGQGMGGEGGMGQGMPDIFPRGGQNSGRQGPMGSMGQGMGNMGQGMNQSMSGMNQGMGGMGQGTEGDMGGMVPPGFRRIAGDIVARFRHPNDQNNPVTTEFRIVIPLATAGKLIGKGGEALKAARAQLGCGVLQIHPQPANGLPFRVLELVSTEPAGSGRCAAVDALMFYAEQLVMDCLEREACIRMLVPHGQAGALLGHKKSIITQMPSIINCLARMHSEKDTPPVGRENDQMLLLQGPPECVLHGVRIAIMLLRGYVVRAQRVEAMEPNPQLPLAQLVAISNAAAAAAAIGGAMGMGGMGMGMGMPAHGGMASAAPGMGMHGEGGMGMMGMGMGMGMDPSMAMNMGMAAMGGIGGMGAGMGGGAMGGLGGMAGAMSGMGGMGGMGQGMGSGMQGMQGMTGGMGMGVGMGVAAPSPVVLPAAAPAPAAAPVKLTVMVPAAMAFQPTGINEQNLEQVRAVTGANVVLNPARLPTGECELTVAGNMQQAMEAHKLVTNIMQVGTQLQQQLQQQQAQQQQLAAQQQQYATQQQQYTVQQQYAALQAFSASQALAMQMPGQGTASLQGQAAGMIGHAAANPMAAFMQQPATGQVQSYGSLASAASVSAPMTTGQYGQTNTSQARDAATMAAIAAQLQAQQAQQQQGAGTAAYPAAAAAAAAYGAQYTQQQQAYAQLYSQAYLAAAAAGQQQQAGQVQAQAPQQQQPAPASVNVSSLHPPVATPSAPAAAKSSISDLKKESFYPW